MLEAGNSACKVCALSLTSLWLTKGVCFECTRQASLRGECAFCCSPSRNKTQAPKQTPIISSPNRTTCDQQHVAGNGECDTSGNGSLGNTERQSQRKSRNHHRHKGLFCTHGISFASGFRSIPPQPKTNMRVWLIDILCCLSDRKCFQCDDW